MIYFTLIFNIQLDVCWWIKIKGSSTLLANNGSESQKAHLPCESLFNYAPNFWPQRVLRFLNFYKILLSAKTSISVALIRSVFWRTTQFQQNEHALEDVLALPPWQQPVFLPRRFRDTSPSSCFTCYFKQSTLINLTQWMKCTPFWEIRKQFYNGCLWENSF